MRLYSVKKCFRFKKTLTLIMIFIVIMLSVKMNAFFKYKNERLESSKSRTSGSGVGVTSSNFSIGSFLKFRVAGNVSHCNFRFGDRENFNYSEEEVSFSPELGDKGSYRVLYGVVEGARFNGSDADTVTYVTHSTLEYLFHVVEIVTRWDGLVSVACFLPGTDALYALRLLEKMCFCLKEMENVNVHFVFHVDHPPKRSDCVDANVSSVSNDSLPRDDNKMGDTCYVESQLATNSSYRCKYNLVYPVNVARNVARYGSKSKFILVSDIELFPSENLVPEFLNMIKRLKERSKSLGDHYFTKKRHVYVVPVFEVAEDEPDVPRTKMQLLDLYGKERAVYFHRYVCLHCQRFPGLQRWLQGKVHPRIKPGSIQPLLVVKREFPYHRWEPVYIGDNGEPLYSELLTWEGQQDKMTQMHEMCLLDYRFVILNGAFLVHTPGMKRKRNENVESNKSKQNSSGVTPEGISSRRAEHMRRNSYIYRVITHDVVGKYRNNPRCRIH